jgi:hypothetical protein
MWSDLLVAAAVAGSVAYKSNPIKQTVKQISQIYQNLISNETNANTGFE